MSACFWCCRARGLGGILSWLVRLNLRVGVVAVVTALLMGSAVARATTITVNTKSDETNPADGSCSLREAVIAANTESASGSAPGECPAGSGVDTIVLGPGTYTLSSGELSITGELMITGAGASATTIDGGGADRVFDVQSQAIDSISGLTITGGHAHDGMSGMPGNSGSPGQSGGGIDNAGLLTLTSVVVSGNHAGGGGTGGENVGMDPSGLPGGAGGDGGGIYNSGTLTVSDSTISGDEAGPGGGGGLGAGATGGGGGTGGSGGGILSTSGGSLTIEGTTVVANHAGVGGAGNSGTAGGGPGGSGGTGGGVRTTGKLVLDGSLVFENAAGQGGNGGGGTITNLVGGPGGMGGDGGGVFDAAATSQTIVNDTLTGNRAGTGGDGGSPTAMGATRGGSAGSGGGGGAVVSGGAALNMVNATIVANLVGGPGNPGTGPSGTGGPGDAGMGGGISAYGSITSQNTLVSGNSGTNCLGVVTDHGHNLSFPDNSCPGTNGDPTLGPLADNGGPTQTMALGAR